MAKIVLGMGASHGPLLGTPPELWGGRVEADRRNPALVYRDGTFKFDELAKLRAKEHPDQRGAEEASGARHRGRRAESSWPNGANLSGPSPVRAPPVREAGGARF